MNFTNAHETAFTQIYNPKESFMDLHNNEVGRSIANATKNLSIDQVQAKIIEAINNGDLYVLGDNQDQLFLSNDCPDCSVIVLDSNSEKNE